MTSVMVMISNSALVSYNYELMVLLCMGGICTVLQVLQGKLECFLGGEIGALW
jgi:hypothetical protein